MEDYSSPVIAITRCNSTRRKCANDSEFSKFLDRSPFFFIHQEMHVQSDMFEDSPYIKLWPHNSTSVDEYHPTKAVMKSQEFKTITYDPNGILMPVLEIEFGVQ